MRYLYFCLVLLFTTIGFGQKRTRLPEPINLPKYVEYAPSISADGRTLIYQSGRYGLYVNTGKKVPVINAEGRTQKVEDGEQVDFFGVYETTFHVSGQWTRPEPIMAINYFGNGLSPVIGGPSISYDGNFLYFFADYNSPDIGFGREDIFYCTRIKNGWSQPINMGEEINSPGYEGFPSISPDGKNLYFVRENLRKIAYGDERCYLIMRSELGSNGKWKRPIELPAPVNMGCEKAPRIMADGKTLVYSSIKKGGKGDFDLYYSKFQDNGSWSEPVALDMVNTKNSDQSVAISACGDLMYYISNGDIYTYAIPEELRPFKIATVQGYITDSITGKPIQTRIILSDRVTGKVITSTESNPDDGRYTLLASVTNEYTIKAQPNGYKIKYTDLYFKDYLGCNVIAKNFKFKSANISETATARNDIQILTKPTKQTPKEVTQEKPVGEVVFSTQPPKEETERLSAQQTANPTLNKLVNTDTTKVKQEVIAIEQKIAPTQFKISIVITNAETKEVIPEAKVSIKADGSEMELRYNVALKQFETEITPGRNLEIHSEAAGFQSVINKLENIHRSENINVKLNIIKPSILKIVVIDINSNKMIPAKIVITGKDEKEQTDELKEGSIEKVFNKPDEIIIRAFADGYSSVSKSIKIELAPGGKIYEFEARIEKITYSLALRALDIETNQIIGNASFELKDLTKNTIINLTASNSGQVPIEKNGNYQISCSAIGYNSLSQPLLIKDQRNEVVFKIQKTAKKYINIAIEVSDKYTGEILGSRTTSTKGGTISENTLRFEAGKTPDLKVSVKGYSDVSHSISDQDIAVGTVKMKLEKNLYWFDFKAVSIENNSIISTAKFKITSETKENITTESESGVASAGLKPTQKVTIAIIADGFDDYAQTFDPVTALANGNTQVALLMKPVPVKVVAEATKTNTFGELTKGSTITLNKIFFDQSSPVLRDASYEELDNLVQVLADQSEMRIEIRGHTDNTGNFDANVKLSKERCESVVKYLISKGISKKRLQYVGKGPVEPVAPNNNEENKKKNRRVEFIVL